MCKKEVINAELIYFKLSHYLCFKTLSDSWWSLKLYLDIAQIYKITTSRLCFPTHSYFWDISPYVVPFI